MVKKGGIDSTDGPRTDNNRFLDHEMAFSTTHKLECTLLAAVNSDKFPIIKGYVEGKLLPSANGMSGYSVQDVATVVPQSDLPNNQDKGAGKGSSSMTV